MAVAWQVETQSRSTQLGANGQLYTGWKIGYVVDGTVHGDVFVADADYTPEKVRSLLALEAAKVAAVHGLSGEVK